MLVMSWIAFCDIESILILGEQNAETILVTRLNLNIWTYSKRKRSIVKGNVEGKSDGRVK